MGKSLREALDEAVGLKEVAAHMLEDGEREKAALSRELHNELGGLLAVMRMDLAQLKRRIAPTDDEAQAQWQRIDNAIVAGVELKRRITEGLRPTLLDNMGLCTALRWYAEQTCSEAQLRLTCDLPEVEPVLEDDLPITIFRCVQELLANVLSHAKATRVKLSLQSDDKLVVTVEDDGVGMPEGALRREGVHGLQRIAFRMQAVGGEVSTAPVAPHGTRTTLTVPL